MISLQEKEDIAAEVLFLKKLGLKFISQESEEAIGYFRKGYNLVGTIRRDSDGDLITDLLDSNIQGQYAIGPNEKGITERTVTYKVGNRTIDLRNISSPDSDYLDYWDDKNDGCSITFSEGIISCGDSSIDMYKQENRRVVDGTRTEIHRVVREFRRICPDLIDYFIKKYSIRQKVKRR